MKEYNMIYGYKPSTSSKYLSRSHIISSLMVCSTILGIIGTSAVHENHVSANTVNDSVNSTQNYNQNSSIEYGNQHFNNNTNQGQNPQQRQSTELTVLFQYHGTNIAEQSRSVQVGTVVNSANFLPGAFNNEFHTIGNSQYRVSNNQPTTITVQVDQGGQQSNTNNNTLNRNYNQFNSSNQPSTNQNSNNVSVARRVNRPMRRNANPRLSSRQQSTLKNKPITYSKSNSVHLNSERNPDSQDTLDYARAFSGDNPVSYNSYNKRFNQKVTTKVKSSSVQSKIPTTHKHDTRKAIQKVLYNYGYGGRTSNQMLPVNGADVTQLPSSKYNNRNQVINPMLRSNKIHRLATASQFVNQVPMRHSLNPNHFTNVLQEGQLSSSVVKYKPYMTAVCNHYHMTKYEPLLLAIMQTESQGKGYDVMHSSEAVGLKPNSLSPQKSIEASVQYLKSIVNKARNMDEEEENDSDLAFSDYHNYSEDNRLLAQAYNYGANFLDYVSNQKSGYTTQVAKHYSRNVIAPRLGNSNGTTYHFSNQISNANHQNYLYNHGGNYYFGDEVAKNISTNSKVSHLINNIINHAGKNYNFGNNNSLSNNDMISYGFNSINIRMPDNIFGQWHSSNTVPGGLKSARAGELAFFKDGKYLDKVGLFINHSTMMILNHGKLDFQNISSPYWQTHCAGVRYVSDL